MGSENFITDKASLEEPERTGSIASWLMLAFMLLVGVFYAYFENKYVSRNFEQFKLDMLSEADNSLIADDPILNTRDKKTIRGNDTFLLWFGGDSRSSIPFKITDPQALRVKVRAFFPEMKSGPSVLVTVNGNRAYEYEPDWNGKLSRFEFNIAGSLLSEGNNQIEFKTDGAHNIKAGYETINLRNYIGVSKRFPRSFIFFDENHPEPSFKDKPYAYLFFTASMFLVWVIGANFIRAANDISLVRGFRTVILWHAPFALSFFGLFLYSKMTENILVLHPDSFYTFVFIPAAFIFVYYPSRLLIVFMAKVRKDGIPIKGIATKFSFLKFNATHENDEGLAGSIIWFLIKHAATIAIVSFMILLSSAGAFMIFKRQDIAERMADIAYFSLVLGVLLRIFDLKRQD
ncbi:MAG: hypothetical protein HYS21_06220 [Deltaproteobacteria bacterium]|nr:hypothetical protein [Deltaproteobacteria bacterium]